MAGDDVSPKSWTVVTVSISAVSLLAAVAAELARELGFGGWPTVLIALGIAFLGVLLAAPITHVFLGYAQHASNGYALFQPFIGGSTFIILQILGWTLYAVAIAAFITIFYSITSKLPFSSGAIASAVAGGVVAQFSLWLSLRYFDASLNHQPFLRSLWRDSCAFVIVAMIYSIPIIIVLLAALPTFFLSWTTYLAILIPSTYVYSWTYRGRPHNTGARSWPAFRENHHFWSYFDHYFSYRLVAEAKLPSNQLYMFGYHPHGIYPFTTVWATRSLQWKTIFPGLQVDILAASVLFYLPLMREIAMWCGAREVTIRSIKLAFESGKSVMLVPGGEREMRENRPEHPEIVLITRHKGFVRQAIIHGAQLVPVFGFGESQLLDNFRAKSTQEWFAKRTLYGAPHFPYGRFYSPIPNPAAVTVVVGKPVAVKRNAQPTQEEIDQVHREYFMNLRDLFDRHKGSIAGYEHCTIVYPDFDYQKET